MMGFYEFIYGVIGAVVILLAFAVWAKHTDWKTGLAILLLAVMGYSCHLFIPIRSSQNPRIDENNASRSFQTFVNYLERKQYGSESMVKRMFHRRGLLKHQFGSHAHMGFWSYFEKQYGLRSIFGLLFLLGLFGMGYAAWKKPRIGVPFITLMLLASVGLVLYMNFADGCRYNPTTGDAYLEVRNRDYFFTPAYAYFGLALGLGIAGLLDLARRLLKPGTARIIMPVISILVFLPVATMAANWHENDRHDNYYPKNYSMNILDTCEKDAILFTSGDNDTFPLWCVQEVYNYRKDIRVVNLSLFNTDWYVWQMKWQYGVPISLEREQIEWNIYKSGDKVIKRPEKPFIDRARKKRRFLIPMFDREEQRTVKLQDMMVDEVFLENKGRYPLYFSSEPYAESPLNLRDKAMAVGVIYKLDSLNLPRPINSEKGYELYKNLYRFDDLDDPTIYRDENATGVMLGLGFNAIRIADDFYRSGDTVRAIEILEMCVERYPEFYSAYTELAKYYREGGDSAAAQATMDKFGEVITDLVERDPESQFYLSDYGLYLHDTGNSTVGIEKLEEAFNINRNSGYAFRKLAQTLFDIMGDANNTTAYRTQAQNLLQKVTMQHAQYGANLKDPTLQRLIGAFRQGPQTGPPPAPPPSIPGQ
jgi:hypothetical protein